MREIKCGSGRKGGGGILEKEWAGDWHKEQPHLATFAVENETAMGVSGKNRIL